MPAQDPDRQAHEPVREREEAPSRRHGHPHVTHLRHSLGADDALPIDPDLDLEEREPPAPERPPAPSHHPAVLAAVALGGAIGTVCRYGAETLAPAAAGHFPTTTFLVNTTGAFVLGALLTLLLERFPHRAGLWRPFACTGVLGGWTTYSSLVVEADTLARQGHLVLAGGYVATTLVCGIIAAGLGIALARVRRPPAPLTDTAEPLERSWSAGG